MEGEHTFALYSGAMSNTLPGPRLGRRSPGVRCVSDETSRLSRPSRGRPSLRGRRGAMPRYALSAVAARFIQIAARHESDFGRTMPVVDSVRDAPDTFKLIVAGNDGGGQLAK